MATPKKSVHWGTNDSFSDASGSPSFCSTNSDYSSSTLEYVNAQLVAHGFAPPSGLSLDGVSNANAELVVKCLLELLGQRTNDMARVEGLSTKLRVLQYDHERLESMHRATQSTAENAEREMNLHKSRLAAANRTLQAAEAAHKQTSAELQRARSTLQSIRSAHQTELKKKEREVERMVERWSKVVDVQAKLSTVPAGISCANAEVVEGTELLGTGPEVLELALQQAEQARVQLSTENIRLKKLVLRTVNQLHALMFKIHNPGSDEEPPEATMDSVFPFNPPDAAEQRVTMIISDVENMFALTSSQTGCDGLIRDLEEPQPNLRHAAEIARLQDTIGSLRREIQRLQEDSSTQLQEAQTQFEKYVQMNEKMVVDIEHTKIQEKEKLDQFSRDLERGKRTLAEEADKLQKARVAFEAERNSWETERMLVEPRPMAPDPDRVANGAPSRPSPQKQRIQKKVQGKSPVRAFKVGKSNRRRAVTTAQVREALASPGTKKVMPSYQTEVIPIPAITLNPVSHSTGSSSLSPGKALLTSSFVLPPPSPETSLPSRPMDLGRPIPPPQFLTSFSLPTLPELPIPKSSDPLLPSHESLESPITDEDNPMAPPPARTYPVAKPLAQRMVHAYSPIKPSPLSRVLVSISSPDSSSSDAIDSSLTTSDKQSSGKEDEPMPGQKLFPLDSGKQDEEMTLAQQLGIPDSPPDPSLKRKRVNSGASTEGMHQRHKPSTSRTHVAPATAKTTSRGRVIARDLHTISTVVKKKGKITSGAVGSMSDGTKPSRPRATSTRTTSTSSGTAAVASSSKLGESNNTKAEKENEGGDGSKRRSATSTGGTKAPKTTDGKATADAAATSNTKKSSMKQSSSSQPVNTNAMSARARLVAKLPPSSRGPGVSGPRRMLIRSDGESASKKGGD